MQTGNTNALSAILCFLLLCLLLFLVSIVVMEAVNVFMPQLDAAQIQD